MGNVRWTWRSWGGARRTSGMGTYMRKTCWAIACVLGTSVSLTAQAQQPPEPVEGPETASGGGDESPSPAPASASDAAPLTSSPMAPEDASGSGSAVAPEPAAGVAATGSAGVSGGTSGAEQPPVEQADEVPWIRRFVPSSGMYGEVGLFLGVLFPSPDHNFHNEFREHQGLGTAAFDFGIRAAFLPLPYGGVELEGALMPTATDDGQGATIWGVRIHGLLQAPVSRISPFLLVGGGRMGALSDPMENDADPLLHFGIGAKLGINDRVLARLDVRDNLTQKNGAAEGALTHHPEVLLGLSYRLPPIASQRLADELPVDTDGDGFTDRIDACPDQVGPAPQGCPILDADEDGFPDEVDECPNERGVEPHGCPSLDSDGDGFFDDSDECPNEPGVAPAGCPPADTDKDGITDADDRCRDEPETANGYEDDDGCPDELPQAVQEFTGAIQGIQFATGKASITPDSHATLDRAVAVLNEYPKLRLEVAGHTDNVGDRATNVELSTQRAMAVKSYLVEHGIDEARVETVGYGPDRPLVSNDTADGRGQNRRIEFRLLP